MTGPGEYVPDVTEGITRVEDLPKPRIERRKRRVGHSEPLAYRGREIGDEDVGFSNQAMEHGLGFRLCEVERQAPLVAGLQQPREIVLADRISRQIRQIAVGIA